jgi:hypothetical protein
VFSGTCCVSSINTTSGSDDVFVIGGFCAVGWAIVACGAIVGFGVGGMVGVRGVVGCAGDVFDSKSVLDWGADVGGAIYAVACVFWASFFCSHMSGMSGACAIVCDAICSRRFLSSSVSNVFTSGNGATAGAVCGAGGGPEGAGGSASVVFSCSARMSARLCVMGAVAGMSSGFSDSCGIFSDAGFANTVSAYISDGSMSRDVLCRCDGGGVRAIVSVVLDWSGVCCGGVAGEVAVDGGVVGGVISGACVCLRAACSGADRVISGVGGMAGCGVGACVTSDAGCTGGVLGTGDTEGVTDAGACGEGGAVSSFSMGGVVAGGVATDSGCCADCGAVCV